MSHLARRSLLLAAGACLVAAPASARAGGGHGLFHHHRGYYSQTTTTTTGVVPGAAFVGVAPAATFTNMLVAPLAPATVLAYPGVATAPLAYPGVTAASPYSAMSLTGASYGSPAQAPALASAQQQAFSAPAAQASQAAGTYPGLAQAAQRARNWDGGRFVVFLRGLIRGAAGQYGSGAAAILRPIILDLIRTQLGLDPTSAGLGGEVERLLGEVNAGDGQCFTIRVCIEGGTPRVAVGEGSPPATENGPTPGLALPPASASSQTPGLAQPQSGASDDKAPPAPVRPALAPPPPSASLPADDDARRHGEVMSALNGIGESLRKLAEK